MSLMAGFDLVAEISNEMFRKLLEKNLKIGGVPLELREHGTHSVTTLLGQEHHQFRGIAPRVRLLVAKVVDPESIATPRAVAEAIAWLVSSHAQVMALPLGDFIEHEEVSQQIERSAACGTLFFAAAGNAYPEPLLFPARHPLAIAVGGADFAGSLLPECCRLPRLDLVAPAWKIVAPIRDHIPGWRCGSSVACVIAAGVAMLALSASRVPATSLCRESILAVLRRTPAVRAPPKLIRESKSDGQFLDK